MLRLLQQLTGGPMRHTDLIVFIGMWICAAVLVALILAGIIPL